MCGSEWRRNARTVAVHGTVRAEEERQRQRKRQRKKRRWKEEVLKRLQKRADHLQNIARHICAQETRL